MRKSEPKKVMPKKELPKKSVAREPVVEKTAPKKTTPKNTEPTVTTELQYAGKAVPLSDIIDRAKEACGNGAVNIYIKPEENRVYYVSGDNVGSFEI